MAFTLGCAATPTSESTGEYVDDSAITSKVKTAIFNGASLKSNIEQATIVAKGVGGVTSVQNGLRLKN